MKLQALILLGLLCASALAQITITNPLTITLSGVTYGFGKNGNNCGVSRKETGQTDLQLLWTSTLANANDCVPKAIFSVGTDIWVVAQVSANGDLLANANSAAGDGSDFTKVIPTANLVDGTVVIGRIVTTNNAATFGKFNHATQFAAQSATLAWGSFTITSATTCSNTIQLKGNTKDASHFLVDETGARSAVSGNDVFVDFDTTNQEFDGQTAAAKSCPSITTSATITASEVTYGIGKDGNNCGVTRVETSQNELQYLWTTALAANDDCVPKSIVSIGSNIWVVAQVSADGDLLTNTNSAAGAGAEYNKVIPTANLVDGTVVIGRIVITNAAASFGRFAHATQFAAKKADNTWGSFDITEVTTCSTTIQVQGDTESADYFLVDEDGAASTVSGDDVFVGFATETQELSSFTDSDKPCSGLILSITSAIVSLVAMLF